MIPRMNTLTVALIDATYRLKFGYDNAQQLPHEYIDATPFLMASEQEV